MKTKFNKLRIFWTFKICQMAEYQTDSCQISQAMIDVRCENFFPTFNIFFCFSNFLHCGFSCCNFYICKCLLKCNEVKKLHHFVQNNFIFGQTNTRPSNYETDPRAKISPGFAKPINFDIDKWVKKCSLNFLLCNPTIISIKVNCFWAAQRRMLKEPPLIPRTYISRC